MSEPSGPDHKVINLNLKLTTVLFIGSCLFAAGVYLGGMK